MIENLLLAERTTPQHSVSRIAGKLPKRMAEDLKAMADYELRKRRELRTVSLEELMTFLASARGNEVAVWLSHLERYPGELGTLEQAKGLCERDPEGLPEFMARLLRASGLDEMALLDWPDPDKQMRPGRRNRQRWATMSWRSVLRSIAENWHLGKTDVRDLTIYEVRAYSADQNELGGPAKRDPAEASGIGKKPVITIGNDGKGLAELERLRKEQQSAQQGG